MGEKKLGRPTNNPKDIVLKIRMDKNTNDKLIKCSEEMVSIRCMTVSKKNKRSGDNLSKSAASPKNHQHLKRKELA